MAQKVPFSHLRVSEANQSPNRATDRARRLLPLLRLHLPPELLVGASFLHFVPGACLLLLLAVCC
eukprot:COSAG06_NODE_12570_length_1362_cov_1.174980_2_plen_64_part_01